MNQKVLEALREKELAAKMMINKDYVSARDKLLSAKQIFPAIENISSMLTVCEILSAASIDFPGFEIDYYWVLQLMPSSTYSDIRYQYRKLVTSLQPLRHKFPGTDLALKHIQDAFSVLSNQDKRSAYDLRRTESGEGHGSLPLQASFCAGVPHKETAQGSSGCKRSFSTQILGGSNGAAEMLLKGDRTLEPRIQASHVFDEQPDEVVFLESSQFYDKNSKGSMRAGIDMSTDDVNSPMALHSINLKDNFSWSSKTMELKRPNQDFYNFENDRKAEDCEAGQIWATHYRANVPQNCRYAQIDVSLKYSVCVTWLKPVPVSDGERRWCDAGLPVACGSFDLDKEMIDKESWPMVASYKCSWVHGVTDKQFEIYPKRGEIWALYKNWDLDEWVHNPEIVKGCKFELVEILSDFSKYSGVNGACLVKVDGFKSIFQRQTIGGNAVTVHIPPSHLYIFSHNVPAYRFTGGEIEKVVSGMFELDQLALPDDMIWDTCPKKEAKEENSSNSSFNSLERLPALESNSENKFLSPRWSTEDFVIGQVWAVHCRKNFMPRKYARINKVITEGLVCVTFLEPQPILDSEINWKKENLPIACGIFRVSETSVNLDMSEFSHLVSCQRNTTKPLYKIFPLKGEIWAMYKNWNNNWKYSDFDRCQYGVVEILTDFLEGKGITIAKLGHVKGCLTFFHRQQYDGFDLTHVVSEREMVSFSHQIPAFRVPGIVNHGIPGSSWHLEPSALPPTLGN